MARRKRLWTCEIPRERIRAGMLLKRLQDHVHDPEASPLLQTQLTAATWLLGRIMPQAEADKNVKFTGELTLGNLIAQAAMASHDIQKEREDAVVE